MSLDPDCDLRRTRHAQRMESAPTLRGDGDRRDQAHHAAWQETHASHNATEASE